MAEFDQTGRSSWTSDLAEIPEKYGVTNVYGDLGQLFAWTAVAEPRLAAALMGMLVKGLGADHVLWGTDAVWTGAPQWQIEGLRRLEIPEDMQKKYGFKPLGPADGPVKTGDLRAAMRRGSTISTSGPSSSGPTALPRSRPTMYRTGRAAAICATATSAMRGDHMAVVETERHGQILVVRMNRPERLNALNHEMRTRLAETWTEFRPR